MPEISNNDISNRISMAEIKLSSLQKQLSTTIKQVSIISSKQDSSISNSALSSSDKIATAAALIALFAFLVAIWQAYISRKHNRLSVKPKLDLYTLCIDSEPIKIQLMNYGLGPAVISDITYEIGGKKYRSDKTETLMEFTDIFKKPIDVGVITYYTIHDQTIINANNSVDLLIFENSHTNKQYISDICNKLNDLTIYASYSCMYGDEYHYKSSSIL